MEHFLASALLLLGLIVLLGSLDDIIVDVLTWWKVPKSRSKPLTHEISPATGEKPEIAIFVANWHEADVLGPMVERNLANFTYGPVRFVLGVYPNDTETVAVAQELAERFPGSVEVVVNRRNGPTSKGQMLNEMFARVFAKPASAPDLVIMHDSEDVIAPRSFDVYAIESRRHAMIQVPIFSLDSRDRSLVAATYMEEFAERHTGEMLLREELGAFVPSAGVGTCLRKDLILHFIAERGHVLQPGSVTEDYVLGAEAHQAGFSTAFASYRDVTAPGSPIIATFEYFPKTFGASLRQRTRWTFGIGFESARRLGWFGSAWNRFFLYRDRKGAVANFLPLFSIVLLAACLLVRPDFSAFAPWQRTLLLAVLGINSLSLALRLVQKSLSLRKIYGSYDVLGLLARWPFALVINALAAARAWRSFIVESGLASKPIAWAKTQHELPATFNLAGASVAVARSAAGKRPATRMSVSNRIGGAVAFACVALLVAGGLRIYEPLMAPVTEQLSDVIASEFFDREEQRIVEGRRLGAGLDPVEDAAPAEMATATVSGQVKAAVRLRQTAETLAEFSLQSARSRDDEVITAALPARVATQSEVTVAMAENDGEDAIVSETSAAADAAPAEQLRNDPVTRAALRATATSLAEVSLQEIARGDQWLIDLARPAVRGDVVALLQEDDEDLTGDEETPLADAVIRPTETRESVMSLAGASLADWAKRDAEILAQAVPPERAAPGQTVVAEVSETGMPPETRESIMSLAGSSLADTAKRDADVLVGAVPLAMAPVEEMVVSELDGARAATETRESVMSLAGATLADREKRDAKVLSQATPAAIAVMDSAFDVAIGAEKEPADAYERDEIAGEALRSIAAAKNSESEIEEAVVSPDLIATAASVKRNAVAERAEKQTVRKATAGKKRVKISKLRAKSKASRRKVVKAKSAPHKVAEKAVVSAPKRATTFLRRGCQGEGCGGTPVAKLSKSAGLWVVTQ